MLEHLETPPIIRKLAISANMSPSKLKRLFKQIFGADIFSYYQQFRMKETDRIDNAPVFNCAQLQDSTPIFAKVDTL